MAIAEQIYAIVKNLPPHEAQEILAFAELIRSRSALMNSDDVNRDNSGSGQMGSQREPLTSWTQLVDSLAGVWVDDFPSLDAVRMQEGADVERETL